MPRDATTGVGAGRVASTSQVAIGWTDSHFHQFRTEDAGYTVPFEEWGEEREFDDQGACPPEDCGGVGGYAEVLEALAEPRHREHEEMLSCRPGRTCSQTCCARRWSDVTRRLVP